MIFTVVFACTVQGEKRTFLLLIAALPPSGSNLKDYPRIIEPQHDKTNKMNVRPAKTDQTGCPQEESLDP